MEFDPKRWAPMGKRSGLKVLIAVPRWLGGATTARWIMRHRWALAIIFYLRNPRDLF